MIDFEVKTDKRDLRRLEQVLKRTPAALPGILVRAVNKTGRWGRTRVVREIAAETGIKQKGVRRGVWLQRASRSYPTAVIRIGGKRIPIIHFGARQTKGGVVYTKPGAGEQTTIPSAFITRMPTGHRGVFKRKAKTEGGEDLVPRLPIRELKGASLGVIAGHAPQVIARVTDQCGDRLSLEIGRQIDYVLAKQQARRAG